jgi:DNA-binding CsgD family transcriptional regulator
MAAAALGADPPAFFRWVQGLAVSGDPRFAEVGAVEPLLDERAETVGGELRHSVWHMTHLPTWPEVRAARGLTHRRNRGVDVRYVTSERTLAALPMLSSHHHPYLRVGPVVGPLLVLDHTVVYVGAPFGHPRTGTVWSSSNAPVVAEAVRCFETTWSAAHPAVAPGEDPPFTRRMVDIAFLLTEGASDREIARRLHVSERTVSADVAEIVRRLGARGRAHAIALVGSGGQ